MVLRRTQKYIFIGLAVIIALAIALTFTDRTAFAEKANDVPVITVVAQDKTFTYKDNKIEPTDFTVAEEIENRKINAPLAEKISLVDMWLSKGADYKTALGVCFPLLTRTVDSIAEYLYEEPVDAYVLYKNGKFTVKPEKTGRALDENKLYATVYYTLKFGGGGEVKAYTIKLEPTATAADLRGNLKLRSSYTTDFSSSKPGRAHNVSLALSKFDGVVIPPDGTLSFNKTVGERTVANGFESAKIIVDGKYTEGVGGGVCQASTALYNAALVAGLDCFANAHSICPSYCPAGLDAMISSVSDLTVKNNTDHNIYLSVDVGNGKGRVSVYGEPPKFTVVPESVIIDTVKHEEIETTDTDRKYFGPDAVSGDRLLVSAGKDGIVSETYLKYYKNGAMVKREKIRRNEYKTVAQVVAVCP